MTKAPTDESAVSAAVTRPRGRPRRDIDLDEVADAVADLFAEGGIDNVSIGSTSERLDVSRATLYRSVPSKEHLLGILFERSARELTESAQEIMKNGETPRDRLVGLLSRHVEAAIDMRHYMSVFFGGGELPPEVYGRWHEWSRSYEAIWLKAVKQAMKSGFLDKSDPVIATRLLLGMCIWISRWFRPEEGYTKEQISDAVVSLLDRRL